MCTIRNTAYLNIFSFGKGVCLDLERHYFEQRCVYFSVSIVKQSWIRSNVCSPKPDRHGASWACSALHFNSAHKSTCHLRRPELTPNHVYQQQAESKWRRYLPTLEKMKLKFIAASWLPAAVWLSDDKRFGVMAAASYAVYTPLKLIHTLFT